MHPCRVSQRAACVRACVRGAVGCVWGTTGQARGLVWLAGRQDRVDRPSRGSDSVPAKQSEGREGAPTSLHPNGRSSFALLGLRVGRSSMACVGEREKFCAHATAAAAAAHRHRTHSQHYILIHARAHDTAAHHGDTARVHALMYVQRDHILRRPSADAVDGERKSVAYVPAGMCTTPRLSCCLPRGLFLLRCGSISRQWTAMWYSSSASRRQGVSPAGRWSRSSSSFASASRRRGRRSLGCSWGSGARVTFPCNETTSFECVFPSSSVVVSITCRRLNLSRQLALVTLYEGYYR
jgi:hypothetical protein